MIKISKRRKIVIQIGYNSVSRRLDENSQIAQDDWNLVLDEK